MWASDIFESDPDSRSDHDCRRIHALLRGLKSFDKFTERIQLYMCRAFRYQRFVKLLLRLMTEIHNSTVTAFFQIHAAEAVFNTVKYRYEKNVDKRGRVNGLPPLMHVHVCTCKCKVFFCGTATSYPLFGR